MSKHSTCDGVVRRDFLKLGVLGGLSLNLSGYLRSVQAAEGPRKLKSAIFIDLPGGPSHMDSFDLKPDAPEEYRGEFSPIKTNVSGVEISEHLPKLAQVADKFTILRGVSHNVAAHALGREYMNTGNRPIPAIEYPGYGSVISKEVAANPRLPDYVAVPRSNHPAGYLGVRYAALETNATPRAGQPFSVRGITVGNGLTVKDIERRSSLLRDLDTAFRGFEEQNPTLAGLDQFQQQVYNMITAKEAREAFDISKESPEVAGRFGEDGFGTSCLLAARLVESGVPFVTVSTGGWDTHQQNFTRLKDQLLPRLDEGLSALFTTLEDKGLLDETVVMVTGEFGRTPKVNQRGGRDHYPRAMFVLMTGGGIRRGQAVGASDEKGEGPLSEGYTPEQVAASFYHAIGIDHNKEYHTDTGRPVMIVRGGSVIEELFG